MFGTALVALMAIVQFDQTVQVQKGTRLEITNFSGEVTIKTWDRDAVRVEVNHSDRETIDIRPGDQRLVIRGRSRTGSARSLDYAISVPRWMAIHVMGTYSDVTMDGVGGEVNVETTGGDINVNGGSGFVSLKSVQGQISLRNAKGRIEVSGVQEGIQLADLSGDVTAETTNGGIVLERVDAANVDLYAVNGSLFYDGPIRDKGIYRLTTHNGVVALALAEKVNATVSVRTFNGSFRSTFPVKYDDQGPNNRRRFTLTFGNGSARVELESFNGAVALRRPGEPAPTRQSRGRDRTR
jgi:DUF4097 and DUF4098 domain-containing protein YvlB